jgi:hypothetical protein
MGCICSRGQDKKGADRAVHNGPDAGFSRKRRSGYSAYDSGELAMLSGKASSAKVRILVFLNFSFRSFSLFVENWIRFGILVVLFWCFVFIF